MIIQLIKSYLQREMSDVKIWLAFAETLKFCVFDVRV